MFAAPLVDRIQFEDDDPEYPRLVHDPERALSHTFGDCPRNGVSGLKARRERLDMTAATLDEVAKKKPAELSAEQQVAAELVLQARERGLSLTGPDGLLKQPTKSDSS